MNTRSTVPWLAFGIVGLIVCSAPAGAKAAPADAPAIKTLSTRPETVAGDDVLIEVKPPAGAALSTLSVTANGAPVADMRPDARGDALIGLVSGLKPGRTVIRAVAAGGPAAELTVVDHPLQGPVFSGPQQQPFVCETAAFGLSGTPDASCAVPTQVAYQYRTRGGQFKPYDPAKPRPDDMAVVRPPHSPSTDYVVRVETGVINRAVYQIAVLGAPGQPAPTPWRAPTGWNGRLIYTFGPGCGPAYRQGRSTAGVLNDLFLSRGYAVASSSLNVFGNDCNDVLSAETLMMVKEHFIDTFGPPAFTIGWGPSGGAMQQHLIAQNYPGLLDGLMPQLSWSDTISLFGVMTDCSLIGRATQGWTDAQRGAVAGFTSWENCVQGQGQPSDAKPGAFTWVNATFSPGVLVAGAQPAMPAGPGVSRCDPIVPAASIYDRVTNPKGVRCSIYDNEINAIGADPKTGFARRPIDNVGVQYGLGALNSGKISFDQFIDLNQKIGGYDRDGEMQAARTSADAESLRLAYALGRVETGGGDLGRVPIIDFRTYREPFPDVHDRVRSFATRERLTKANGRADNQVIVVYDDKLPGGANAVGGELLDAMDDWLSAIKADTGAGSDIDRVVRNKPPGLTDGCYTADGRRISEPAKIDGGTCAKLYPVHADPRLVSGAPLAGDVLKCQLREPNPTDYTPRLTAAQMAQVKRVFPKGVCDYAKPGVGQQSVSGAWLAYSAPGTAVPIGQ